MKNLTNKIKFIVATAVAGLGVSSCSLDMLPLNEVVLENYWTDKSDVESVVTSCYAGMQESGYVEKLIVWGETRSDNLTVGPNVPDGLKDLMKGALKTTSNYCDWASMYNVINRCNTVLYYAPQVAEEDPNYTKSDLAINVAECKALRAMSYLTLIKTFRDVPFSLDPSIDDNQDYTQPATSFEVILDSLILDIESCKDDAPRRYTEAAYNTGRITRAAMYSLLAELYLWRASDYNLPRELQNEYYRKCIAACDWVINFKLAQYSNNDFRDVSGNTIVLSSLIDNNVFNSYGYPLLAEYNTGGTQPRAFNAIFGEGNSYESIFELTYKYNSNITVNTEVSYYYGGHKDNGATVQYVAANGNLMPSAPTADQYDDKSLFPVRSDYRSAAAFHFEDKDAYDIYKYVSYPVSLNNVGQTTRFTYPEQKNSTRQYDVQYENWIFYRLTEIMLFRAEAEIELAGNLNASASESTPAEEEAAEGEEGSEAKPRKAATIVDGSSLTTAEQLFDDAFTLISAVYVRSNPAANPVNGSATSRPNRSDYDGDGISSTKDKMEKLLMNERHREFLFEGKRYYDLVRQARRIGNTSQFTEAIQSKYGEASKAVIIKMAMMDFMYMPIWKKQIQLNRNLNQNPAYAEEDEIVKN